MAENYFEIEEMFRAAGFMVVSPASMTLVQQKAIFEQAEIIAGINGAAFANALFRYGKPLATGALVSSGRDRCGHPAMAKVFGFRMPVF
jgi:Glycosyltransferase 61